MKKILLLLTTLAASAFAYNYSGTWTNQSEYRYNDPIKLKINGNTITPFLNRDDQIVKLRAKNSTNTATGLYEAWGFGVKNLVLYIKPINNTKIKVYEKKIDTARKTVVTRSFIFAKKVNIVRNIKKRYIGNWKSSSNFSAISKLTIRNAGNKLYVRAWKNTPNGQRPLGLARAKYYNNRLHITWYRGNLVVNATIRGLNYNSERNRYETLELNLSAKNISTGLTNRQTIYFTKKHHNTNIQPPIHTMKKHIKVGPIDINLLLNSY